MRDIKFRAKTIHDGKWIVGFGVMPYNASPPETFGRGEDEFWMLHKDWGEGPRITRVVGETVGEFTSLLDKNSKEIWEGDIVKAFIDFGPGGEKEVTFQVKVGPWGVNIEKWNYDEGKLPEIIGNIHDNGDLLCP